MSIADINIVRVRHAANSSSGRSADSSLTRVGSGAQRGLAHLARAEQQHRRIPGQALFQRGRRVAFDRHSFLSDMRSKYKDRDDSDCLEE